MGLGDVVSGMLGGGGKQKQAKWGAGYPDWIQRGWVDTYREAFQPGPDVTPYIAALQGLTPQMQQYRQSMAGLAPQLAGMDPALQKYVSTLGGYGQQIAGAAGALPTDLSQLYANAIKGSWGQGARGMEELGLRGGALERGKVSMSQQLGQALTQGALQAEQDRAARIAQQAQMYGQAGQMTSQQAALQAQRAALLGQQGSIYQTAAGMIPQEATLSMMPFDIQNQLYQQALQRKTNAMSAIVGTPQLGQYMAPPNTATLFGNWLGNMSSGLGQAWAYGQGMQGAGGLAGASGAGSAGAPAAMSSLATSVPWWAFAA